MGQFCFKNFNEKRVKKLKRWTIVKKKREGKRVKRVEREGEKLKAPTWARVKGDEDDPKNPPTLLLFLAIIEGMFLAGIIIITACILHMPQKPPHQQVYVELTLSLSIYITFSLLRGSWIEKKLKKLSPWIFCQIAMSKRVSVCATTKKLSDTNVTSKRKKRLKRKKLNQNFETNIRYAYIYHQYM